MVPKIKDFDHNENLVIRYAHNMLFAEKYSILYLYKDKTSLVAIAEKLNFTLNIVIMEKCGSDAEREFYLDLADSESLSKAGLVSAIENDEFNLQQSCDENFEPVCDFTENKAVDTSENTFSIFSAVNSICRDFLQGTILYKFLQERLLPKIYPRGVPPELLPT